MKISGTVLNSKNYAPIALAKIRLKVQDKEIETPFFTDEHGYYEFKSDQDYIGQPLKYTIEKDGFEEKTFSTVIDNAEIQKKFLLRETEALKDKFATLKGF
ncbi:MAG TPA: carboxypeptidase-like regulatory domain-containing protein, partial [Candidatus Nanoarchaeia archaeon]|nr:carboxypeptidase-like regulatory domain-containing protein [Candidatus Nanoarchaeia archaeon]